MPRITPALWICTLLLLVLPASAQAAMEELLGKYATAKESCQDPAMQVFEIRRGVIEGPNFLCIVAGPQAGGTGVEAYQSKCTQGDGVHLGTLTLDLSATADHIRISLPEKQDWLTLYPCK
jgi:hypothetical protein